MQEEVFRLVFLGEFLIVALYKLFYGILEKKIDKGKVFDACKTKLESKIVKLRGDLIDLQESMATEGKSSLGDKHETARARMQSEMEAIGNQLKETEEMLQELMRLANQSASTLIKTGDLVQTDMGTFYISVPLGKLEIIGQTIYAISLKSPLGQKIKGLQLNSAFELNGKSSRILAIE